MLTRIGAAIFAVLAVFLTGPLSSEVSGEPLGRELKEALDGVLECERPDGGWMYVCDRGVRVAGFTSITRRAERIAGAVGLASWDLVVLRSPGTPAGGLLFLRAYQKTGDEPYLAAARRTGDLLVNVQLPSGGWFSEMPVYGKRLATWFRTIVPWTTLDDDVTPGATRFLLALWEVTHEPHYRDAAEHGLDLLLKAQLPSGAWPLTWRPTWLQLLSSNFEDWPSLNDGATTCVIHTLIAGARVLDRPELLEAARRGGDWLLGAQGVSPNAGWAQQYNEEGHPAPGRRFEPVALATWESRYALEALSALAVTTGDQNFCTAFPRGIDWLVRSALTPGCWARLYSVKSNVPIYSDLRGNSVPSVIQAKRPYRWEGDFGIPALFASLRLDESGRPVGPGSRLSDATWRVHGDTEGCAGDESERSARSHSLNPRIRMAEAASRLVALEPAGAAACTALAWRPAL